MRITPTTIHNSCKKLAQLNRVIEYLGSYMEEVHFQTVALEKNVDVEFQTIFKNYEKNANEILDRIKEQERSVIETIQVFYNNRIEKENQKLQDKKQQVLKYIKSEETEISNKIQNLLYTILLIQQNVQEHVNNLNNENHVVNLQSKIKDLEKEKKVKFKDFDKEKNEKNVKLKENSEKKIKDIEKHFLKVKNDLIISYENKNELSPRIKNSFNDIISKIKILKNKIFSLKKDLSNEQIISSQNFTGFKARLHSMIDQLIILEKEKNDELHDFQKQKEHLYANLRNSLKEEKNKKNSQLQFLENEIVNLQNEQRISKSQIKKALIQYEKQKNKNINNIEDEIEEKMKEFQQEIKNIEADIQKDRDIIKSKILSREDEIKNKSSEFKEIELNVSNSKNELNTEFSENIEKFKENSEKEKEKENETYDQKYNNFKQLLEDQSNYILKSEEANQKIKELQEELNLIKSNFISEISQIDITPPTENTDYQNEIDELSKKIDIEYSEKQEKCQKLIDSEKVNFSEEEEKFKDKLELRHREEIKNVSTNFKDDDFKEKIAFYENEYKNFNKQLQSIQVINKDDIINQVKNDEKDENSIENLEKRKTQLVEFISKEREELLSNFESMEKIEKEKLPILIDPSSIQIDTSKIEKITLSSEKNIQNLQSTISEKEKELLSLQEENKKYLALLGGKSIFDDDDVIQKLCLRLSTYQKTNNDKIQSEKERNASIINALRNQIDLAEKQNESELKMTQNNNDKDHNIFREKFQEQTNYRKQIQNEFNENIENFQKNHEEERNKKINIFSKQKQEIEENIIKMRNEISDNERDKLKTEEEKTNLMLNEKIDRLKNNFDSQIEKLSNNKETIKNQSSLEISNAEEKRNKLTDSVKSRPMRSEEKTVIDKLTIILDEETEKLKKIGMEFIDMRESLAIRDKQINQRFGNAPQVLESKNQKRKGVSSALNRKKPLPPLAQPYIFI